VSPADKPHDFPHKLGDYEVLLPIGTGGMGGVYLAERAIMEGVRRRYAVKLMHPRLRGEEGVNEQLLNEARMVAAIEHPNVVSLVEAGESGGDVFLVMDYVEGATLSTLIRTAIKSKRPMPLDVVGRILSDALAGLHAAHEAIGPDGAPLDLVHRDFSPQNLLTGLDGITRLTDFGIAKALRQLSSTATGMVKGKVSYLAPEQALSKPVDRRTDLWAAGVVLWEALTSRRLFKGDHDAAIILEVVSGEPPPPPSSMRAEVPEEIDRVVAQALQRVPAQRASDAAEMRAAIEAAWQQVGLADHLTVGSYVAEVAGARLDRRRVQAAEALELRERLGKLSDSATRAAVSAAAGVESSSTTVSFQGAEAQAAREATGVTETASVRELADRVRNPRGRTAVVVGGAMLAAALAYGAYALWPTAVAETSAEPAAPALPTSTSAAPAATPSSLASGTAATAPAPELSVTLRANAPIAQLGIEGRSAIVLAEPVAELALELTERERQGPLEVRAVSKDGRKAKAVIEVTDTAVVIEFADEATPRRVRPVPRAKPKAKPRDPGLAPSPYDEK
jgi:serine/threonine-protein kinase